MEKFKLYEVWFSSSDLYNDIVKNTLYNDTFKSIIVDKDYNNVFQNMLFQFHNYYKFYNTMHTRKDSFKSIILNMIIDITPAYLKILKGETTKMEKSIYEYGNINFQGTTSNKKDEETFIKPNSSNNYTYTQDNNKKLLDSLIINQQAWNKWINEFSDEFDYPLSEPETKGINTTWKAIINNRKNILLNKKSIGNLLLLKTDNKNDLVSAINELFDSFASEIVELSNKIDKNTNWIAEPISTDSTNSTILKDGKIYTPQGTFNPDNITMKIIDGKAVAIGFDASSTVNTIIKYNSISFRDKDGTEIMNLGHKNEGSNGVIVENAPIYEGNIVNKTYVDSKITPIKNNKEVK